MSTLFAFNLNGGKELHLACFRGFYFYRGTQSLHCAVCFQFSNFVLWIFRKNTEPYF